MFLMVGRLYVEARFAFPEGEFSIGVRLNLRRGFGPTFLLGLCLLHFALGVRPSAQSSPAVLSETAL